MFKLTPDEVDDPDVAFQLRGAGFVAQWLRRNLARGKAFADGEIIEEVNAGLSMDQRGEKQAIRLIGLKAGYCGERLAGYCAATARVWRGWPRRRGRHTAQARRGHGEEHCEGTAKALTETPQTAPPIRPCRSH
jgi:hypothetical protein